MPLLINESPEGSRFSLRFPLLHLVGSCAVLTVLGLIILVCWYPGPWYAVMNVNKILIVIMAVDLVCGPMLTFFLLRPAKSKTHLFVDGCIIVSIQIVALIYGTITLYDARPVALVLEVDRLVVVSASELPKGFSVKSLPASVEVVVQDGISLFDVRVPGSQEEYMQSLEMSLAGINPAVRVDWWRSYDHVAVEKLVTKLQPLEQLIARKFEYAKIMEEFCQNSDYSISELYYLPMITAHNSSWIAIANNQGKILGYKPIDGF